MEKIVIVGAGQAGLSLAAKLRKLGYGGDLTLIGAESHPPYERPPLSKAFLLGKVEQDRMQLRPPSFYAEQDITLLTGKTVTRIARDDKTVHLKDMSLSYDALALTTGSRPRRLPTELGGALRGVHVLRGIDDARALARACRPGRRALIVGGGYIGLEAAAVLRGLGIEVCLIEASPRILSRVAAPETSDAIRALHRTKGVLIKEAVGLKHLVGQDHVEEARLSDGTNIPVDVVLVGIGALPRDELARDCGLATEDGILVDARGRTSDPAIYAAGDCARFSFAGHSTRLESVQNAIDQAETVAETMMGQSPIYAPVPWFWSDQFDLKLQIAGLSRGYDTVVAREGHRPGAKSFWYFAKDKLIAVDSLNDPASFMLARRLLARACPVSMEDIRDGAKDLKSLMNVS
ncbi:NAD(P)/FAD-dependent oxidoreductase [Celeribacter naphthalenivorans]|uniref:NAD(P)/FAD-dependent oxidoreductase n=1 Tax=Celeribacter naphthalenivorans TaxID=1614694 RepID=UPI001CFA4A34|nr:FAD-dependent oxidoreductase [Celeribacter naphthalenivorans]